VKICGITTVEDALFVERAGGDAVGVVLCSDSPRAVEIETAHEIFSSLGPFIAKVAVTHTQSPRELRDILRIHPTAIQLYHDLEIPPSSGVSTIRVVKKGGPIPADCACVCVDESMGTGRAYDPMFARDVVCRSPLPVMLSGGLSPENLGTAIMTVKPYAVDICSGVEERPGRKDRRRVVRCIQESRGYPKSVI
jgi:phosphoribosylanthranilate isomerase